MLFKLIIIVATVHLLAAQAGNGGVLSIFWCGFSGDFCGQSHDDDLNSKTTHVILAFANVNSDGSINFDTSNADQLAKLIKQWHIDGKKVIFSVGGQNGHWSNVFKDAKSMQTFADSATLILKQHVLDGIDFDLEDYTAKPLDVANVISLTRTAFDKSFSPFRKLIVVSPECVGVYQGTTVSNAAGYAFNYWVPILNQVINQIDLVQPQAYNNWQNGYAGGSYEYLLDVYLNWLNLVSLSGQPIPNFVGVPQNKLVLGLLASTSAGGAGYLATPQTLAKVSAEIQKRTGSKIGGFMMWDSHWDKLNGFIISNASLAAMG